jgi:hypothetical protein
MSVPESASSAAPGRVRRANSNEFNVTARSVAKSGQSLLNATNPGVV